MFIPTYPNTLYLKISLLLQNKNVLALKNTEDIQKFFQTVKSGNLYLNVLSISRQKLSSKPML